MNIVKNEFPIDVTCLDGSTAEVTIKLPPLRDMPKYLQLLDDDVLMVELLTGRDPAWVDGLAAESVFAICDKAAQEMRPTVAAWVERQAAKAKLHAPLIESMNQAKASIGSSLPRP